MRTKIYRQRLFGIKKLTDDNGVKELEYDAGHDDTPYELLQNYIKHKDTVGNFKEFLEKKLIDKHSCPETAAADLAATLIRGRKLVSPGEYARLNNHGDVLFYHMNYLLECHNFQYI